MVSIFSHQHCVFSFYDGFGEKYSNKPVARKPLPLLRGNYRTIRCRRLPSSQDLSNVKQVRTRKNIEGTKWIWKMKMNYSNPKGWITHIIGYVWDKRANDHNDNDMSTLLMGLLLKHFCTMEELSFSFCIII